MGEYVSMYQYAGICMSIHVYIPMSMYGPPRMYVCMQACLCLLSMYGCISPGEIDIGDMQRRGGKTRI